MLFSCCCYSLLLIQIAVVWKLVVVEKWIDDDVFRVNCIHNWLSLRPRCFCVILVTLHSSTLTLALYLSPPLEKSSAINLITQSQFPLDFCSHHYFQFLTVILRHFTNKTLVVRFLSAQALEINYFYDDLF